MSRTISWREPPHEREEHPLPPALLRSWFGGEPPLGEPIVMSCDLYAIGFLSAMLGMLSDDDDYGAIAALLAALHKFGSVELIVRS